MTITNETLRKIRRVYRLSLASMSALLDISESYLWMIERNERNLTDRVKRKLVQELDLTQDKLERILAVYDEYAF